MSASVIAIVSLAVVVAVLVGRDVAKWLFKKDTLVENRRRAAIHLSATLQAYGLKRLPDMLSDYAVGDYSGFAEKLHDFAKLVMTPGGEAAVVAEFDGVFANVLTKKLASEEGRALISAKLDDKKDSPDAKNVGSAAAAVAPAKA